MLSKSGCVMSMKPALFFLFSFPPPAPRALGFSGHHCSCARRATDRQETTVVQGVVRHVVLADEDGHPFTRPVEQRMDFDEVARAVDDGERYSGALVGLVGTQTRDPGRSAAEGSAKRFHFADSAACHARLEGI